MVDFSIGLQDLSNIILNNNPINGSFPSTFAENEQDDQEVTNPSMIIYSLIAFIFTMGGSFFSALSFTLMKYSINRD